ncbi:MAG TPA: hypothetical protein VF145_13725 [Chitinophagaceae bacterium]
MINRNNYEEYLLLYLDGELDSTERSEVEQFVRLNPDIEAELELLQQTVLKPESVSFGEKETLYRNGDELHTGNFQEWFLLYVDNELTDKQKNEVETFVLRHPELQSEFIQLKQAVLTPEEIIFTDKKSLYRTTEHKRRVIVMFRWAALAAAAVTGIIAILMFSGNETPADVANRNSVKTGQEVPAISGTNTTPIEPAGINAKDNPVAAGKEKSGNKIESQPYRGRQKTIQEEVPVIAYQLPEQSMPVEISGETAINTEKPESAIAAIDDGKYREKENVVKTGPTVEENTMADYAVRNQELNTENDNSLMVGALQVNPDKLRGFFRKATRFLSGKAKDNEEPEGKLKIASIELTKSKKKSP